MFLLRLVKLHANVAAFRGRTKGKRRQIRNAILARYFHEVVDDNPVLAESMIFARMQDHTFPVDLYNARKLMIVFVPERPNISGGVISIFSIAKHLRQLKRDHGYEVVVMTRPSPHHLTYFRNLNFQNSENVYRIEQLLLCKGVEELYIHVPEYEAKSFVTYLTPEELDYFHSRKTVLVNILNQNVELMPTKEELGDLRRLSSGIGQSVAHHAYFNQAVANEFDLPTLLLPAYTDLSEYPPSDVSAKEKLIIYSPDDAPYKNKCIETIRRELPDYTLVEIRDITFDTFMDYATRCMFSITFGEGFDGYLAQPIHQGGVGFAVYNATFFPSPHFKDYPNIFANGEEMVANICSQIRILADDHAAYRDLNARFRQEYEGLYSYEEYVQQVRKLSLREYELYPNSSAAPVDR